MLLPTKEFLSLMVLFAPLFSQRIWQTVLVLVVGAIPSTWETNSECNFARDGFA